MRLPPPEGAAPTGWSGVFPPPPSDTLGGHVVGLRQQIRSFDDARHADIVNERLPTFQQPAFPLVPAPSMWVPRLAAAHDGSGDGEGVDPANMSVEAYIRRVLEEEVPGETAEKLAERLARMHLSGLRPRGLKRFETT